MRGVVRRKLMKHCSSPALGTPFNTPLDLSEKGCFRCSTIWPSFIIVLGLVSPAQDFNLKLPNHIFQINVCDRTCCVHGDLKLRTGRKWASVSDRVTAGFDPDGNGLEVPNHFGP